MKLFDEATRARLAREWMNSSENQAAFAARHGVSARTLRDWVKTYAPRQPVEEVKAILKETIRKLQAVLAGLDVNDAACRAVSPSGNGLDPVASRAEPPGPVGSAGATNERLVAGEAAEPRKPAVGQRRPEAETCMPEPPTPPPQSEPPSGGVRPKRKRGSFFADIEVVESVTLREAAAPHGSQALPVQPPPTTPPKAPVSGAPRRIPMPSPGMLPWV